MRKKVNSALARLYSRRPQIFYEFSLKDQHWCEDPDRYLLPLANKPGVEIRQILPEETSSFSEVLHRKRAREMPGRFSRGEQCWGALKDGRLAGFMWTSTSSIYEALTHLTFLPEAGEFFLYDGIMMKEQRGGSIYVGITALMLHHMATQLECIKGYAFCRPEKFRPFQAMYRRARIAEMRAVQFVTPVLILGVAFHRFEAVDPGTGERLPAPTCTQREGQRNGRRYFKGGGF